MELIRGCRETASTRPHRGWGQRYRVSRDVYGPKGTSAVTDGSVGHEAPGSCHHHYGGSWVKGRAHRLCKEFEQ